jgi:hypothetical protein
MGNRLNYYKALKSIITGQQTGTAYSYESFNTHTGNSTRKISRSSQMQKPVFVQCQNGQGTYFSKLCTFSPLLAAECVHQFAANVLMLETLCSSWVWPLLTAHFIPTSLPPHSKPALRGNNSVAKSVYSQVTLLSYSKINNNLVPTHLLVSNMLFKIF